MNLGLHIKQSDVMLDSIKKYYEEYKISCVQFFLHSPIKRIKKLSDEKKKELTNISHYCHDHKIRIFIHAPYTVNIGKTLTNPKSSQLDWWIASVIKELKIADSLGVKSVIIHLGKALELDKQIAIDNMYLSLQVIAKHISKAKVELLLETSAGQGTELLSNIDDYLQFYKSMTSEMKKKIFLCLDTCHMFAAGNDIKTKSGVQKLFKKIDDVVGINSVHLIHLNDSSTEFNSHHDRHASIGTGYIGKETLLEVFNIAEKNNIQMILETPKDTIENDLLLLNRRNVK